MDTQLRELILKPFLELEQESIQIQPRIIIIDGLDEAATKDVQSKIVELIAKSIKTHGARIPLLWSIFSRPESHITHAFTGHASSSPFYWEIILYASEELDKEIELYLRDFLRNEMACWTGGFLGLSSGTDEWLSDKDIEELVRLCRRLFIYATTLARYIMNPNSYSPEKSEHGYAEHHSVRLRDGEFIIPGFVDTHTHASQFPGKLVFFRSPRVCVVDQCFRGGQYTLLQWLETVIFPTTTPCHYGSFHLAAITIFAGVVNQYGVCSPKCHMDRKRTPEDYYVEDSPEQSIEETEDIINHIYSLVPRSSDAILIGTASEPLVQPILSPHFALTCTREQHSGLRDLAHRCNREHPDESRIRIGSHSGESQISYLDVGVKVRLGTDVSGGYAVSMLKVVQDTSIAPKILPWRLAFLIQRNTHVKTSSPFANRQVPIPNLFFLTTLGARVCNLSEKIGLFSEEKSFNTLVSVPDDTGAIGVWGMEKLEENLERSMFCGDDRNILKVYVQGCLVGGLSFVPQ
ncbi:Guanine deaminase [Leucoagaricus sp. SymC.cos]|nr:Guanine deaminase [Leucoagaricus sp. SymC.cos]